MMKLGLNTAILPDCSFEEVVDIASKFGYECLEVCCWPKGKAQRRYAGVTHIDIYNLTPEKIEYYKNYAKEKNIYISSLAYYPNALSENSDEAEIAVEHIIKLIKTAKLFGLNLVTTFIGKNKSKTVEENIELMKKTWSPIMKIAEENEVKVGIENCPMLFTKDEWPGGNNLASTPYVWEEMFKISPNLGLNYDPSHPYLLGMELENAIYKYSDRIFHVHFKDIKILQDKVNFYGKFSYPSLWHTPKLPGLGDIDFAKFVSTLNEVGFKGSACLEMEDRAFEGSFEDTVNGIRKSATYLKTLI